MTQVACLACLAFLGLISLSIAQAPLAAKECDKMIDLVYVLDASESIRWKNWQHMKKWLASITDTFEIGGDKVHIGVVVFSTWANLYIKLNEFDNNEAFAKKMKWPPKSGGTTNHAAALERAKQNFDQHGRAQADRVILLITDGTPTRREGEEVIIAENLKKSGITIITIGIGLPNFDELDRMASPYSDKGVVALDADKMSFSLDDFQGLDGIFDNIAKAGCDDHEIITTSPIPVTTTARVVEVCHLVKKIDLVFLIDSSASILEENWPIVTKFFADIVRSLQIGKDNVLVGTIIFSRGAGVAFRLGDHEDVEGCALCDECECLSTEAMIMTIENLGFRASTTNHARAYKKAMLQIYDKSPRKDDPETQRVAIMMTDGHSTRFEDETVPLGTQFRDEYGVTVINIGVTPWVNIEQLKLLASDKKVDPEYPDDNKFYWYVDDFPSLNQLWDLVKDELCHIDDHKT